jgi:hypothetical protein
MATLALLGSKSPSADSMKREGAASGEGAHADT